MENFRYENEENISSENFTEGDYHQKQFQNGYNKNQNSEKENFTKNDYHQNPFQKAYNKNQNPEKGNNNPNIFMQQIDSEKEIFYPKVHMSPQMDLNNNFKTQKSFYEKRFSPMEKIQDTQIKQKSDSCIFTKLPNDRLRVTIAADKMLSSILYGIPKRFYNRQTNNWYFPITSESDIREILAANYIILYKEFESLATISEPNEPYIFVGCEEYDPKVISICRSIKNSKYNQLEKKWMIEQQQYNNLIRLLKQENIKYKIVSQYQNY